MTGMATPEQMFRPWSIISPKEINPVSGSPVRAAETANPDMKVKSYPACSMSRAESASQQHGMIWHLVLARSRESCFDGVVISSSRPRKTICLRPYLQSSWVPPGTQRRPMTTARILEDGTALEMFWTNGGRSRFHASWLRDNSPDPETRSPGNGQRLITILDQPADIRLASAVVDGGRLEVEFLPEEKTVSFSLPWLKAHGYDESPRRRPAWTDAVIDRWDGSLQEKIPTASWRVVSRERAALGSWLSAVRKLGFALLTDVPPESGFLCKVAETFGYVRETNYGRWFEVRAEVNPSNLAYTNLGLQAHTDNPYRDPVPTLQLLACLENSVDGGESLVVDG